VKQQIFFRVLKECGQIFTINAGLRLTVVENPVSIKMLKYAPDVFGIDEQGQPQNRVGAGQQSLRRYCQLANVVRRNQKNMRIEIGRHLPRIVGVLPFDGVNSPSERRVHRVRRGEPAQADAESLDPVGQSPA
jgi:hypothetical protein